MSYWWQKTMHIVNRRPVAFQEVLSDNTLQGELPTPITPEMLLHGRELISFNIIPQMQPNYYENFNDFVNSDNIRFNFKKLSECNEKLFNIYHHEFIQNLISQAIDQKDRYKPVKHKRLCIGDIVLLVEPNTKRNNYPMGIIKKITVNSLDEVTSAEVLKGKNKEIVHRHSSTIIPLLRSDKSSVDDPVPHTYENDTRPARIERGAAVRARNNIRDFYQNDV